ncbi:hypothetical protein KRP22_011465 [Phytophthora ramorum]|nr:hypothetical protein KRP22_10668 [Phytophthora ramorum]
MRIFALLSACAVALTTAVVAHKEVVSEPVKLEGDVWEGGLLRYRTAVAEEAEPQDGTNSTLLETSTELLALLSPVSGSSCVVKEKYDLQITVSLCLDFDEYIKLWLMKKWSISNAEYKSKTFKYIKCHSDTYGYSLAADSTPASFSSQPKIEVLSGTDPSTVTGAVVVRVCKSLDCGVLPTDIVVTTLSGINLAIPVSIRNLVDCPTPVDAVSCRSDNKCKCSCPAGLSDVGGVCSCPGGQSLVGGVCKCPGDQTLIDGSCSCPGDQALVDNLCSCPGDQKLANGLCSCPGDQKLAGGICSCPGDQKLISGVCGCPGDQQLVNGVCSCPGDQTLVNNVCSCPGDEKLANGLCSCPGDQTLVGDKCSCPGDEKLIDNVCGCPGDQKLVSNVCSCPADQKLVNNLCSCPGDQTVVGNVCSCPGDQDLVDGDQQLIDGKCSCLGDQSLVSNVCSCPGDQTLVNNLCSCPGDQKLVNGACSCPGDQQLVNDVCSCPGDQKLINDVCGCPGDQQLINGLCSCPGDQTLVGGACACQGDQTLVNNLCSCPGNQKLINDVCSCPGDQKLLDDVCSCLGDQTLVNNACSCPGDQTLVNNLCSCPGDQNLIDGVCSCPGDQTLVDGVCSCLGGGQLLVNDVCSCPGDQTLIGGVCSCPYGQAPVRGVCSCPEGEHVEDGVCVPTCYWKTDNAGFHCPWSDPEKESLKLKDDCLVHAPVPKDSYVNDARTNENDATNTDPAIAITATREGDITGTTHKAPWKDYALTPANLENEVTFSSFGVFDLALTATDYRYHSTCTGCIAIVDNYPPTVKDQCETSDAQANPVLYSASNLDAAIAEEAKFAAFHSPENVVNNGAYDPTTGANERCDVTVAALQDFFETSPTELRSIDTTCFDADFVADLVQGMPTASPFLLSELEMNQLKCTRCCFKALTLQEHYYDYHCGTALENMEKKTATSDSCSFGHCLQMSTEDLVTSEAKITDPANAKTATIIAGLPTPITPGTKDIHRSITCTSFGGGCSYTPTLGDLFEHSSTWDVTVDSSYDVDNYVFWRYSVGLEAWSTWDDTAPLTFTEAETAVYVEAWTHCGLVYAETFNVVLHPHSPHDVCLQFKDMWTELTAEPCTVDSHMCAYPGSDFVLMKFAYDSEAGLTHNANTVKGKYTDVKCYVKLAGSGALASVSKGPMSLAWTPGPYGRIEVTKELAFELVHDPSTATNTDVLLECDFTFTHYDSSTVETEPCTHSVSITDCDPAEVETYGAEAVCKAGECLSPSGTPGPFEACGGSVYTTESAVTHEKTLSGECCEDCSNKLFCVALPESGVDGVQRCAPLSLPSQLVMALLGEGNWKSTATPSMVAALLGAGALVVAVAVVVVKRRNLRAAHAMEDYDAYYPLLK